MRKRQFSEQTLCLQDSGVQKRPQSDLQGLRSLPRLAVSVEEAGAMLNVARSTAYLMKKKGELPCVRIGGKTVVPVAALETMLAGMTAQITGRAG